MKLRIVSLAILCLALATVSAWADYDNGPINGTTDAWTINFGYVVSDTFVAFSGAINGFAFGIWEFPGDTMQTVDWTITATENGTGVGQTSNVTDKYISTNQYGYNIDLITVQGLGVPVTRGNTYWLNLQNASVSSGDPVYWDENSGEGCNGNGCPSSASESALGTIPSEAFTIIALGAVPEPSSIMLFGSGIVGLAGMLRRRLF